MSWRYGAWIGQLTNEQHASGGVWLVGDNPVEKTQDYPGKNNGEFKVKLWYASPEKYQHGKYPAKDRKESDEWEYVRTIGETLHCFVNGLCYETSARSEGVDIPPETLREWALLPPNSVACGITILRRLSAPPLQAGQGEGYELWWCKGAYRKKPLRLTSWEYQLIIPFGGTWKLRHQPSDSLFQLEFLGSYVFLPRSGLDEWEFCTDLMQSLSIQNAVILF